MKIYIDESANTGCCLLDEHGQLNFKNQQIFTLGCVLITNDEEEKSIIEKYNQFKKQFNIKNEIKGSELCTRSRNKELEYFIETLLNNKNYFVCLYDKKFLLSTTLLSGLLGYFAKQEDPLLFYSIANVLSKQDDEFYKQYITFLLNKNDQTCENFYKFLLEYNYNKIDIQIIDLFKECVQQLLDEKDYNNDINLFIDIEKYENYNYINFINLNALGEALLNIKLDKNLLNSDISIIHDKINTFDKYIKSSLKEVDFNNIEFADSKSETLLQLSDNLASITRKFVEETLNAFKNRAEWQDQSSFSLLQTTKIINKLGLGNILWDLSICDRAAIMSVQYMLNNKIPKNNIQFISIYSDCLQIINENLSNMKNVGLDDLKK